ncbi:MAG: BrnT family toxin [Pirellulaceae bacterium]
MGLAFEWDVSKAKVNTRKHGVTFEEASIVFADPLSVTIYDPVHSEDEDRYIALGESQRRRLLVVVFTDRGDRIRIISARVATRRERKDYEKGR